MSADFTKVDKLVNAAMKSGLTNLGNDIKKRAIVLSPIDSGDLRKSAKINVSASSNDDKVIVSFNTPYARRRHYENNLHPSTKYYLTNALKSITNAEKYFPKVF